MQQIATKREVREIARALMTLNGTTTNLDIKNVLRSKGFSAKQSQVRDFMQEVIGEDADITTQDNGTFRSYSLLAPIQAVDTDDDDVADDVAALDDDLVDTMVKMIIDHDNVCADYEVRGAGGIGPTLQYSNVTRGQAKANWAVASGQPYAFARTRKLMTA